MQVLTQMSSPNLYNLFIVSVAQKSTTILKLRAKLFNFVCNKNYV